MKNLLENYDLAGRQISNRIVMAPMTRARRPDYVADQETATYYQQRATAGLIITEGTPISPEGQGYLNVPGIWSSEQTQGWKIVTEAVHAAGGTIFAQLWHVGRMSHTSLQPTNGAPVSSTTTPVRDPKFQVFTVKEDGTEGFVDPSVPRALATEEMARVVADFGRGAKNAATAGFDGVELHAANGYLFEQFLNPLLNDRTDRYGGTVENRARLTLETVDALVDNLGADRVGVRLAPHNQQFEMQDYDGVEETYFYLARELASRKVAYIHLNDNWAAGRSVIDDEFLAEFRKHFAGTIILAGAMTFERGERLVEAGIIDLPAFGQPFIANPDLVERYRDGVSLANPNRETYYGGGSEGYTDYPRAVDTKGVLS
ncbi:alkene reductase [Agrobacterium tumefaciens]|uniref:Alkene reductase n=1 Tax=Agrobacterium tumefaciens TaxID=358 RepID=A0AA44F779_AGRTU|nr:alkene reductase [Agrobacterium tumefaciens]NTB87632.1 alkene reductase [Agrobacterium tumefaciens]NTC20000.1 alkene reductase [Agrobacterium tumefaciens]NTC29819.1 alkene reductase [Agrobacterium tumefaciens]